MVGRRTGVGDRARGLGGLVTAVLMLLAGCVFVLIEATTAHACECQPITRSDAVDQADVIMFGTVRAVRPVSDPASGLEFTMAVRYVYKGTAYTEQLVQTPDTSACGFTARAGTTMVVFATERPDPATQYAYELVSTQCAGNIVTDSPPRGLGTPQPPLPGSSADVGSADRINDLLGNIMIGVGLGVLGLVIIVGAALAWLWRPGRQDR